MEMYHTPTKANLNPIVKLQRTAPDGTNIITQDSTYAVNNIFFFAVLVDKQEGTLYTNAAWALSERSLDGHQYFFVAYAYDTNYIFAEPIANVTDALIVTAFDNMVIEGTAKGFNPKSNVTDNQATGLPKAYMVHND